MTTNKLIAWLTGILTLLLALFAFILSFNALTDLAAHHGVSIPPLFPFVVEFAVVIFSLNALYRSLNGDSAWWQWVLIIMSSLLAGTFNVAHAADDFLSQTIAAMPSLFLLFSFESFLNLVRHGVTRHDVVQTLAELNQQVQSGRAELDRITQQIDKQQTKSAEVKRVSVQEMNHAKQDKIERRQMRVATLIHEGLSQSQIADELGVSTSTIKRDLKIVQNGRNGS